MNQMKVKKGLCEKHKNTLDERCDCIVCDFEYCHGKVEECLGVLEDIEIMACDLNIEDEVVLNRISSRVGKFMAYARGDIKKEEWENVERVEVGDD